MLVNTLLKRHDQFVALIFVWLQAKTLFPLIMAICYFGELSACPDMSDHNQQKLHNQFIASINVWLYIIYHNNHSNSIQTYWKFLISKHITHHWTQMTAPTYHNNHSNFSRDIDNLLFQSTFGLLGHRWQDPNEMTYFNWCKSHCQRLHIEWKVYSLFNPSSTKLTKWSHTL